MTHPLRVAAPTVTTSSALDSLILLTEAKLPSLTTGPEATEASDLLPGPAASPALPQ